MARRVTPAGAFQSRTDLAIGVAERHERAVARAFAAALRRVRRLIPVDDVAAALRHGRVDEAIAAAALDHYREALKEAFDAVAVAFEEAGAAGAKRITRTAGEAVRNRPWAPAAHRRPRYVAPAIRKAAGDGFAFDRFDVATQRTLREYQDALIRELGDSARETVESVILQGVRADDPFTAIARSLRDSIALTPSQAESVANYRRLLEDLDPAALQRALRDKALDAAIEDAIDAGEFLDDDLIEQATQSYADNFLDYRASGIARTESLRASNLGLRDSYRQAVDRGVFPAGAVRRHWKISTDEPERTCKICLGIAAANVDGVGLDEDFQGADGDPPVHPRCRCTVEYVTDLDMLEETLQLQ